MSNVYSELLELISELETELKSLNFWSEEHPGEDALQSSAPFCVDTLRFEQWLQFIFIPRLQFIAEQQSLLPAAANILPAAEELYKHNYQQMKALLLIIARFDRLSHRLI